MPHPLAKAARARKDGKAWRLPASSGSCTDGHPPKSGRKPSPAPLIRRNSRLETDTSAGAVHAFPDAIEASLRLAATAMQILQVPADEVDRVVQGVRDSGYRQVLVPERPPDAPPPAPPPGPTSGEPADT